MKKLLKIKDIEKLAEKILELDEISGKEIDNLLLLFHVKGRLVYPRYPREKWTHLLPSGLGKTLSYRQAVRLRTALSERFFSFPLRAVFDKSPYAPDILKALQEVCERPGMQGVGQAFKSFAKDYPSEFAMFGGESPRFHKLRRLSAFCMCRPFHPASTWFQIKKTPLKHETPSE
jgi:hypothetical protein